MKTLLTSVFFVIGISIFGQTGTLWLKDGRIMEGRYMFKDSSSLVFLETNPFRNYWKIPIDYIDSMEFPSGRSAASGRPLFIGKHEGLKLIPIKIIDGNIIFLKGANSLVLAVIMGIATSGISIVGAITGKAIIYGVAGGTGFIGYIAFVNGILKLKKAGILWKVKEYPPTE